MGIINRPWDNTATWTVPWSKAGGDYTELAYHISYTQPVTNRQAGMKETWDVTVEVNKWVQGVRPNYGLMRFGNLENFYWDNTALQDRRPMLTVEYTSNATGTGATQSRPTAGRATTATQARAYGIDGRVLSGKSERKGAAGAITVGRNP